MKFNINRRDLKFFALGILTAFIFSAIYNWEDTVGSIKEGYSQGQQANPLALRTAVDRKSALEIHFYSYHRRKQ
ncbi:MAG: hypothetical protein R6U03_09305 [Gillisia sp.]